MATNESACYAVAKALQPGGRLLACLAAGHQSGAIDGIQWEQLRKSLIELIQSHDLLEETVTRVLAENSRLRKELDTKQQLSLFK